MASNLKPQISLAQDKAKEKLDLNNSAISDRSNRLFSLLEGDESSIPRDQLDQYLNEYLTNTVGRRAITPLGYDWLKLRQLLSIKEKLAYITGLIYAQRGTNRSTYNIPLNDTRSVDNRRLEITLNEVIMNVERKLLSHETFTESRTLRNSALNRFECKLSVPEGIELNSFVLRVKDLCKAEGLDTLVESTHFTNESDAQKILKVSNILKQISASGVNIGEYILKGFEKFDEKIKALRDLDKHYKHVTKTLNMVHRIVQKGYHSAIRPQQQMKLDQVLGKLGMTNKVNEALKNYNKIENFEKNEEHGMLDELFEEIKGQANFKETIYKMAISEADLTERFFSSCGLTLTTIAKSGLDHQKAKAFGAKKKDFEADTQSRRGEVRNRIFEIAVGMGTRGDLNDQEFEIANSLFNQFPDLFFAKEEDNYKEPGDREHELHYHKMEKVLSAILRRRAPALAFTNKIRRGSGGRILYKFIENALKGKERGIFKHIRRIRNDADDASIFAMIIMAQNETKNQVYYQDKDKSKKHENRYGKILKKISFVKHGRDAVSEAMGPTANKALAFTEEAAKKGLQLGKGTLKVGNTIVSNTGRASTRLLENGTGKFNSMMKKDGYKRWKTLLYPIYGATAIIQPLAKQGNKGFTYTAKEGSKYLDEFGNTVNKGYEGAKDMVSKATGEQVDGLYRGLLYGVDKTTDLAAKGISAGGQRAKDNYDTRQQRGILGALYAAAEEDNGLLDLMQSTDVQKILNLQERGPYLFDEDGRSPITEHVNKKDENDPKEVGKEISKTISNNLSILLKQADEKIKQKLKEEEDLFNSGEDDQKKAKRQGRINKEINAANEEKTIIKSIHDQTINIVPILNNPTDKDGKWKEGDIHTAIDDIQKKLKGAGKPINKTKTEIGNAAGGLIKDLADAEGGKKVLETEIKNEIIKYESEIEKSKIRGATAVDQRTALDNAKTAKEQRIQKENELGEQIAKIEETRTELRIKKAFLSRLEKIYNEFETLQKINDGIGANIPTKEQIEQLKNFRKNLDILLHPEENKTRKIELKDISEDAKNSLLEELKKTA